MSGARPVPSWVPASSRPALERLLAGNARFVAGEAGASRTWRPGLERGQSPFAVVLGCSDSRAPAELLFDQGLGDLFVVRVAGNVVAPSVAGSVEFAVQAFGLGLVLVLGHTHCGAVNATLERFLDGRAPGGNVSDIVERVSPAVRTVLEARGAVRGEARGGVPGEARGGVPGEARGAVAGEARGGVPGEAARAELVDLAVRANVRSSVSHLAHASRRLEQSVHTGALAIVGAVLSLESGVVELLE